MASHHALRLTALAFALNAAWAAAQQPPAAPPPAATAAPARDDAKKLEKIEVRDDGTLERRESTASKIIVNSAEIMKFGDTNALEVLRRLPGVTVGGSGRRGSEIRMRGMGGGYTQILIDGERAPPGLTLDSISPDLIERIEIIRSATAEFSTQAIAGTINIVLKRAVSQRKRDVRLGANIADNRVDGNASVTVSDRNGILSHSVTAFVSRFDNRYDNFTEQVVEDPTGRVVQAYSALPSGEGSGDNAGLSARLSWAFERGHTLNWDANVFASRNGQHGQGRYIQVSGLPPPYESSDGASSNRGYNGRTQLSWTRRFPDGDRIEARFGLNFNERRSANDFEAITFGGGTFLDRHTENGTREHGITSSGKYSIAARTGHSFVSGWDLASSERDETRLQDDVRPSAGTRLLLDDSFGARVTRLALFSQDEWDLTSRFSVYAGLRWEGIRTESDGNRFEGAASSTSVFSPILQSLWKLPGSQKDQLRAAIARTYKPPSTYQLVPRRVFAIENTPTTPDYAGNPELDPEMSWGLDLSWEHYPAGGGNIAVSAFHRRIDGVFVQETGLEDGGLYVQRPRNGGRARTQGIEIDAKGQLRQLVDTVLAVDLRANLSFNDSKVDHVPGPGNRIPGQNRWSATLGFDWKIAPDKLTVGSSGSYRSGGYFRSSLREESYAMSLSQLEVYALYRYSPAVQVRLIGADLLARDYEGFNRYTDAAGRVTRTSISPRYRRFGVSLELKL